MPNQEKSLTAKTEIVELNFGDIEIRMLASDGTPLKRGANEPARRHMFEVRGPGIDPDRVKSVEIPKLDYGKNDVVTVKVEMYTFALKGKGSADGESERPGVEDPQGDEEQAG